MPQTLKNIIPPLLTKVLFAPLRLLLLLILILLLLQYSYSYSKLNALSSGSKIVVKPVLSVFFLQLIVLLSRNAKFIER